MTAASTSLEETIRATLDEQLAAIRNLDAEQAAACYADDAEVVTVAGTFSGKDEILEYFRWLFETSTQIDVEPFGFGSRIVDHMVIREERQRYHFTNGHVDEFPAMLVFEYDDEGRITRSASYFDRLVMVREESKQARGLTGFTMRAIVNAAEGAMARGVPAHS